MKTSYRTTDRGGKPFVLVPKTDFERMCEKIEERADIAAYIAAKSRGQELVPTAIADRLIDGENPLRVWREHRKLTLEDVASKADISAPYLSQLETGLRSASLGVLRKLAGALGVDLVDLTPAAEEASPKRSMRGAHRSKKSPAPSRARRRPMGYSG